MKRSLTIALPLFAASILTVPATAQDHGGHSGQEETGGNSETSQDPAPAVTAGHAAHAANNISVPEGPSAPASMGDMDHAGMDHSAMSPAVMAGTPAPGPDHETPPPPNAPTGPPRAADAIWGQDAMYASRRSLQQNHGDFPLFWFQADRAEMRIRNGRNGYLWGVQGYYGGPTQRLWFKSEGEGGLGRKVDDAEFQALYARAITPFVDLQAGVRQDLAGPDTSYAVIGVQGLAPGMFEIGAAMFLSHRGDVTARFEAELDQRITQRLILQPRIEINLAAQDVPHMGIGAGLDRAEAGVRLRYEIRREFAPYVGIEQSWRAGRSADFAKAVGERAAMTNFVAGIRFWF